MSAKSNPVEGRPLPLADVAEIVSGYGFPKDMQGKAVGELPFFKVGDISAAWNSGQKKLTQAKHYLDGSEASAIKAKPFPKGTVVFAKIGEAIKLNRRAILGQRSIVDNNVMGLIPKEGMVDQNYLFYWSLMLRLGDISQATTVPSVRKSDVEQLSFPWVPLDQQKRIVAEIEKQFSRLDEAVANLKRVKANLKRYKAAVLKAAVEGRLVETEAELARREGRSFETGAQLLQRILETRRSQWQGKGKYKEPGAPDTTDLPKLPEGWVWATVESLSMKVADGVHKKPNYLPEGIPFVTVKNLTAGSGISFEELNYVSAEDHEEFCKRTHPERGDILISKDGTLGVIRLVETDQAFSIFVSVALVKPVMHDMSRYLVTAFESPPVQRQMVPKGSGLQHIHLEDLRADCIPIPPLVEQQRIVAEVDRCLSLANEAEAQIYTNLQRVERLRQSILQQLFYPRYQ